MGGVMQGLKVALIHEWLISWGGSESVLLSLARLFPDAPIFTSVYAPDARVRAAFSESEIRPSALQVVPAIRSVYRSTLPLMPWAFGRMDLSGFDLVVSSSHALQNLSEWLPVLFTFVIVTLLLAICGISTRLTTQGF